MKKKFTKSELKSAVQQLREEHEQEAETAKKAADWVQEQLCIGRVWICNPYHNTGIYHDPATPVNYVIVCVHETYGPHVEAWIKKLDSTSWAKRNDEWVYGYVPNTIFYDVETPHGKFKLTFEYFNNHVGGF